MSKLVAIKLRIERLKKELEKSEEELEIAYRKLDEEMEREESLAVVV
ncbi:hypothetical protein NSS71_07910 [Niallia sp. FSL W8-0951]